MDAPKDPRSGAMTFGGAALVVFGLWWLIQVSGLIDPRVLDIINRSAGGLILIGLGIIVILLSRRGAFQAPRRGTRLYRSRTDRVFGGVLGGLGAYLGVEPIILRVAVALLTLPWNLGLVVAYIVMWVVIPEEPLETGYVTSTPAPPAPPYPGA